MPECAGDWGGDAPPRDLCDDIKVKLMSNNINIEENGDNGFNSNCVGFDYDG